MLLGHKSWFMNILDLFLWCEHHREFVSTSVFSFFFFFCLFFSPCSQSQWFLCLLLACLVCVSASALPELADYRAISVKARRLCQSSAPVFVSGLSCGVSSDTILATGLFFRWLLFCSMVQVVLSNYCFLSFFSFFCRKIYAWVRNPTLSPLISLWQRQFLITKAKWTLPFMPVKHVGQ